jgi:hypothetical protein
MSSIAVENAQFSVRAAQNRAKTPASPDEMTRRDGGEARAASVQLCAVAGRVYISLPPWALVSEPLSMRGELVFDFIVVGLVSSSGRFESSPMRISVGTAAMWV